MDYDVFIMNLNRTPVELEAGRVCHRRAEAPRTRLGRRASEWPALPASGDEGKGAALVRRYFSATKAEPDFL